MIYNIYVSMNPGGILGNQSVPLPIVIHDHSGIELSSDGNKSKKVFLQT